MEFSVYIEASGEIVRSGHCMPKDFEAQANESLGEKVWPEKLDDEKWRIVAGAKVPRAADLAALERELLAAIDRAADDIHGRILPTSVSLMETHRAKRAEALAIQDDPTIAAALTPRLTAEAAISGLSREACALAVLARAAEDEALSAAIDGIRRLGKSAVRAAATEEGKRAAAEAIDWSPVTG